MNQSFRSLNVALVELVEDGVDLNALDNANNTALHWAAGANHVETVKWLLKRKVTFIAPSFADVFIVLLSVLLQQLLLSDMFAISPKFTFAFCLGEYKCSEYARRYSTSSRTFITPTTPLPLLPCLLHFSIFQ